MRPSSTPHRAPLSESFVLSLAERPNRDRHRLFLAEGTRFLAAASEAGFELAGLVVSPAGFACPVCGPLIRRHQARGVPLLRLRYPRFAEVVAAIRGREPAFETQGVLALLRQPWEPLPSLVSPEDLWIGVESVQNPGNLGTILRTGDAVGASGVIVFDRSSEGSASGVDPFDPATVRATMGSIFRHRFVRTTHREFRRWGRLTVIGASPSAVLDYRQVDYRRPVLLMLGDERAGLSEGQKRTCDRLVQIPMIGHPDSLNIAMAGAVILYEIHNQRHPLDVRRSS